MCTWWKWAQNRLQDDLELAGTAAIVVAAVAMRHADLQEIKTELCLALAVFVCPPGLLVRQMSW